MPAGDWADQTSFDVKFEWGPTGLAAVAAPFVVVIDVLRFTTAVDSAVSRGARVFPYRWKDGSASAFAASVGAVLADGQDAAGPSLSPIRLQRLQAGDAVVLPSPNGSTCAAAAADTGAVVIAACLRNVRSVAAWLNGRRGPVAVIACGERWQDGSLRPSLEDHLGAGAVIAALEGTKSPEAEAAAALWTQSVHSANRMIRECASGRELLARGWVDDLDFALDINASDTVPVLDQGAFEYHA